eukprot:scaffold25569_cov57-Cyclotella_meneghiniana.AAC.4
MDGDCEVGHDSIPASSFARAAAALALESQCSNELPDSDSSISDESSHHESSGGDDSDDDDGSSCNSSNRKLNDVNDLQQSPCGIPLEGSANNDVNISGMMQMGVDNSRCSSEHLQEYSESTPAASNTGLFESDSTVENRGSNHQQQQHSAKKQFDESVNNIMIDDLPDDDNVYNLCRTYANSSASIADSSFSFMASPSPGTPKIKKHSGSKSVNTEQSSLLSRGLNLFGRRAAAASYSRNNNNTLQSHNDDSSSVISDLSHDAKSVKSSATTLRTANNQRTILREDTRMQKHVQESGLNLVKRLIEFLSACPPSPEEQQVVSSVKSKKPRGLTLPASAVGWVSFQMKNLQQDEEDANNLLFSLDDIDCYQVPNQQLQVLKGLLRRVTSLRLTNDKWPPPLPPLMSDAADIAKRKALFSSIPETGTVLSSSRILSKFTDQSSVAGMHSVMEDSVSTGTAAAREMIAVTPLQRYLHELQYNPNIDMRLFPYATKVVVDGIPPHWISNLDTLRNNLNIFQMEKGCILDVNHLFFPSDSASDNNDSSFMYKSVAKLHLSNCAINEAAGLRGRRRPRSSTLKKVPTLSRFPNLQSLDLSRNELFRTKTALAGLSSLPLLSSVNLSCNRLSR